MARKRNKSEEGPATAEARRKSEILRARRAVSFAAGREPSAGADGLKSLAAAETGTVPVGRENSTDSPPASTPFAAAVRNMVVGLFSSGDPPRAQSEVKVRQDEQPAATIQRVVNVSTDPLAKLARRHISQSGAGPVGDRGAEKELCRRVLVNLAKARMQTLLADYQPGQLTRLDEIPSPDGA